MSQYKNTPFWHIGVSKTEIPESKLSHSVDVAIIGAGFTGLATSLHLLRSGCTVALFDAMDIGDGASGKTAA